jgi:ribose transport system ATP-binding protein
MVEIAKAVRLSTKLLILDEPTAPLSRAEVGRLFELIRRTAARGIGVVFITHHLREVFEICDDITVLREGQVVLAARAADTKLGEVVRAIVGAELAAVEAEDVEPVAGDVAPLLAVDALSVAGKLENVSFQLLPGEILGVAGLVGSGRTVLLKALFGEIRPTTGSVALETRPYAPQGPADAIGQGVYLIPEDRRVHGAVLMHTVEQNVVLSVLGEVAPAFLYRPRVARSLGRRMVQALDLRARGLDQVVGELSGGNQQKVVLGKALLAKPRVFLLDEPTFGVDVQTAAEIIRLMRSEAEAGKAVLWVSSDLTELLNVADRVLVLADGRIKRVVSRGTRGFTEDAILEAIQRTGAVATGGPGGVAAA